MESTGIQRLFYLSWTTIKLNLFFILFSLAGGILLGVGPAWQTMSDLVQEYGMDYQQVTFQKAWQLWKANFKKSNLHFLTFLATFSFVAYNLVLATQMTGWFWLFVDLLLVFVLILLLTLYFYMVLYTSTYEIAVGDLIKLSFVSIFLNFWVFIKILFGLISILILTWQFKGLFLFATFAMIMMWGAYVTRKNRNFIDGKLGRDEANLQKAF
ncbi:DUF624 domain protein [Enterococcus canis]|uniref:DUF624 domain protein n=1 Tax=Enterococcus canis TaxID=214095 RepID=A0A1L8RFB3_9ENTE|nr:DUF624 domain-containing protein [Enterococcus canis]OJG18470.1 DUF624 domain protein [Enterococcus canis]